MGGGRSCCNLYGPVASGPLSSPGKPVRRITGRQGHRGGHRWGMLGLPSRCPEIVWDSTVLYGTVQCRAVQYISTSFRTHCFSRPILPPPARFGEAGADTMQYSLKVPHPLAGSDSVLPVVLLAGDNIPSHPIPGLTSLTSMRLSPRCWGHRRLGPFLPIAHHPHEASPGHLPRLTRHRFGTRCAQS